MIRGPQPKTSTPTFLHYPLFASMFCLERLLIWSLWDQLPAYSMFTKDFQQFSLKIRRRRRRRRWSVVSMNLQGHCSIWCFVGPSWGKKSMGQMVIYDSFVILWLDYIHYDCFLLMMLIGSEKSNKYTITSLNPSNMFKKRCKTAGVVKQDLVFHLPTKLFTIR